MAIVEMKKLKLIGLSSQKDQILDRLALTGGVELKPTADLELTVRGGDARARETLAGDEAKLALALEFLVVQTRRRKLLAKREKDKYAPPKKPLFACRTEVSGEDFAAVELDRDDILRDVDALLAMSARLAELRTEANNLQAAQDALLVYLPLSLRFADIRDTRSTCAYLGAVKNIRDEEVAALAERFGAEIRLGEGRPTYLYAAVLREQATDFLAALNNLGFVRCPFADDCTPEQKMRDLQRRLDEIAAEERELTLSAVEYNALVPRFRLFDDYCRFGLEKLDAEEGFAKTSSAFVLEAFVPARAEETVRAAVAEVTECAELTFEDVAPEDDPPTLCANSALVTPFESITNMYSVPSYRERDPNVFVAVFYFIFFGFMLSDAAYGLLLAVVGFIMLKCLKLERGTKQLVTVITLGGLSTIFWGALFGGWFAMDPGATDFVGWAGFLQQHHLYWFKPLEDPITMLALSIVLGIVQIFVGMGLHAADLFRAGKWSEAVFDVIGWYVVFLGIGLMVLPMALNVPALLTTVGLAVLALGLVMIMTGGALKKKGFGRVTGAFGALYGIVNYLSDILSYTRLFGLGLATGIIGMVMNQLVVLLGGLPVVGFVFGLVVFIVGHVFNLAINLLGAYVHDARLQYIEFFSRFYEGGGHAFAPMGSKLKYTVLKAPASDAEGARQPAASA